MNADYSQSAPDCEFCGAPHPFHKADCPPAIKDALPMTTSFEVDIRRTNPKKLARFQEWMDRYDVRWEILPLGELDIRPPYHPRLYVKRCTDLGDEVYRLVIRGDLTPAGLGNARCDILLDEVLQWYEIRVDGMSKEVLEELGKNCGIYLV